MKEKQRRESADEQSTCMHGAMDKGSRQPILTCIGH
jgi:hypothetical protein